MKGTIKKKGLLAAKPKKRNKGGESGNPSKAENSLCPTIELLISTKSSRASFKGRSRSRKN